MFTCCCLAGRWADSVYRDLLWLTKHIKTTLVDRLVHKYTELDGPAEFAKTKITFCCVKVQLNAAFETSFKVTRKFINPKTDEASLSVN